MVGKHREKVVTVTLEDLIARARNIQMDDRQLREQRLSFVYGNTHIENERITRDIVEQADERVAREEIAEAARMS